MVYVSGPSTAPGLISSREFLPIRDELLPNPEQVRRPSVGVQELPPIDCLDLAVLDALELRALLPVRSCLVTPEPTGTSTVVGRHHHDRSIGRPARARNRAKRRGETSNQRITASEHLAPQGA